MNTSFSKKRYIAEVNQRLEERYLSDKIKFVLNEQQDIVTGLKNELQKFDPSEELILEYLKNFSSNEIKNYEITFNKEFEKKLGKNAFARTLFNIFDIGGEFELIKNLLGKKGIQCSRKDNKMIYWPDGSIAGSKNLNCVTRGVPEILKDGSIRYKLNDQYYYYNNGRAQEISGKKTTFNYICDGSKIIHTGASPAANTGEKKQFKWKFCSKGPYVPSCYGPKIKEVQGCLINIHNLSLGPRKDDSYFGESTLAALKSKFPKFSTGFTDADIATICTKPVGSAAQVEDNVDPDQMGTTNTQTAQVAREVIQAPQALQQRTNQLNIPKPQISLPT